MATERTMQRRKAAMEKLGVESSSTKKPRKKRKLTDEQKQALVERMAKARESREPAKNLSIDESIRDLPADHPLNPNDVKKWIAEQKEFLKGLGRDAKDSKDANIRRTYWDTETYIFNLQRYLSDGVYRDHRYGSEKQNRIRQICTTLAYYPDGTPKRTPGVFYPDIGEEYSNEMAIKDDENYRKKILNKKRVR
jgi:hypothetical protein